MSKKHVEIYEKHVVSTPKGNNLNKKTAIKTTMYIT